MSTEAFSSQLESMYLYTVAVVNSGIFLEFNDLLHEVETTSKLVEYLKNSGLEVTDIIEQYHISEYVAEKQPPKYSAILTIDLNFCNKEDTFTVQLNDGRTVQCKNIKPRYKLYPLNTGVIEFRTEIPKEYWHDQDAIKQIIAHINTLIADPANRERVSWIKQFDQISQQIQSQLLAAVKENDLQELNPPFLDLHKYLSHDDRIQNGQVAVIAHCKPGFDVNNEHYQLAMVDVTPEGVQNMCKSKTEFAFTESFDSLFCTSLDMSQEEAEKYVYDRWVFFLSFHEASWKLIWELDKIMSAIISMSLNYLRKHQKDFSLEIICSINAFINFSWLCIDSHHPRNIANYCLGTQTLFVELQDYMAKSRVNWNTETLATQCVSKMKELEKVVKQVYELGNEVRTRAVTKLLLLLGIFGFASFIVGYYSTVGFLKEISDAYLTIGLVVMMAVFTYIAFKVIE